MNDAVTAHPGSPRSIGVPRPARAIWRRCAAGLAVLAVSACSSMAPTKTASVAPVRTQLVSSYTEDDGFAAFVEGLWPAARARGVSRATFDAAFAGVSPDPKVMELTRRQSEFVKPVWEYLATAVSDKRLEKGRVAAAEWASTLAGIERTYGVDRTVVIGVWGMETNFGGFTGNNYVIRALATLAYNRYRGDYFRSELLAALRILDEGHVAPASMEGSWAGAMGQTQFMPTSFNRYAVDYTGDGKRDIWTTIPDALASTANYLKKHGWRQGLPWGFEVQLPSGFQAGDARQSFAFWQKAGVRRADGAQLPAAGEAGLFYPAGANGPVFLVTSNFKVIKRYNNSNSYALGVAHLGDRVYGGAPVQRPWPVAARPRSRDQVAEREQRLTGFGSNVSEPDGKIDSRTSGVIRDDQVRLGLVPDLYQDIVPPRRLRTASR